MDQVKALKSLGRKNCEGLLSGCAGKGSKIGCGGKVTRFLLLYHLVKTHLFL